MIAPMVWSAAERPGFVADVQAMRRRVVDHIPAREAERQLKLGSGGLRDVEFAVQLLQLVHGRADPSLRAGATLSALDQLTGGVRRPRGRRGPARGVRVPAHARAPHPAPPAAPHPRRTRRRGGAAPAGPLAGLTQGPGRASSTSSGATTAARCAGCTRSSSTARCSPRSPRSRRGRPALPGGGRRRGCPRSATPTRGRRCGTSRRSPAGSRRTAAIQRTLLPVMLEWFADAPDPDAGLFGFRRISDALGTTHWYLAMLRDEGEVAERLARVLATSRYATDLLRARAAGRADARRRPRRRSPRSR